MHDNTTADTGDETDPPGTNVLMVAPAVGDVGDGPCVGCLTETELEAVDVLLVTVTRSPGDKLQAWRAHAPSPPARVGVVSVADSVRSSASAGEVSGTGAGSMPVRTVSDPGDLTGVGIAVTEFLGEWAGDGNRTVVCFDSLTALLQYAEVDRVFRFLNVLTSQIRRSGAVAHFHVTPESHDEQTLGTLASLFDEIRRSDDGTAGAGDVASPTEEPSPPEGDVGDSDGGAADETGFVFPESESLDADASSGGDGTTDAASTSEELAAPASTGDGTTNPTSPDDDPTNGTADAVAPDRSPHDEADAAADDDEGPASPEPSATGEDDLRSSADATAKPVDGPTDEPDPESQPAATVLPVPREGAAGEESGAIAPRPKPRPTRWMDAAWFPERQSPRRIAVGAVSVVVVLVVLASLLGGLPVDDGAPGGGSADGAAPEDDAAVAAGGTGTTASATVTSVAATGTAATPQPTPRPSTSPSPTPDADGGTSESSGTPGGSTGTTDGEESASPTQSASPTATDTPTPEDTLGGLPTETPTLGDTLL